MTRSVLSDDDIELLKRALVRRCNYLGISPEGSAAQFAAGQMLELFDLGLSDEYQLAMGSLVAPNPNAYH